MATKLTDGYVEFPDDTQQSTRYDKDIDAKGTLLEINCFPSSNVTNHSISGAYTWNKPAGCTLIRVIVQGPGGGGSGHGESGGAGGYAEKWINNPPASVTVTIGSRGSGVSYSSAGGDSGTTSFGSYLSATGGRGANRNHGHSGGFGGHGSGGDINLYGGGGTGHDNRGGKGGASFFGGSKFPGWGNNSYGHTNENHFQAPGAGGSSQHTTHGGRAGHGATGMCIVYCYK
jgi:hypothetical protein